MVGSSLCGCDRLAVVVLSGCVCLVAACTMKQNQYSIWLFGGKEGAIQWACGRELRASWETVQLDLLVYGNDLPSTS